MQITYTMKPDIMTDFEEFLAKQSAISMKSRILFGMLGVLCVIGSGTLLYRQDFSLSAVGFVVVGSLLLLMAFRKSKPRSNPYRNALTGKKIDLVVDDNGVRMDVDGKLTSSARWKKIHGAFESEKCFYIETGVNAYFIIDKKAASPDLRKLLEKKTKTTMIVVR